MKIEFKNGSKIKCLESTNNQRGGRADLNIWFDDFELKWYQKLYLNWLLTKDEIFSKILSVFR